MARAEFVVGGLTGEAKAKLHKELDSVLARFPAEQRQEFLELADEAIGEYRVLHKPMAESFERNRQLLEGISHVAYEFEATARSLAHSLRLLDPDMRDQLMLQVRNLRGHPPGFPDPNEIEITAKAALEQAMAAIALAEVLRKKTDGRRAGGAVTALVEALIRAYESTFQKKASAAKGSYYAKVETLILDAAGISESIGEKRREGIKDRLDAKAEQVEDVVKRLHSTLRP